jgi:hypothetical protein
MSVHELCDCGGVSWLTLALVKDQNELHIRIRWPSLSVAAVLYGLCQSLSMFCNHGRMGWREAYLVSVQPLVLAQSKVISFLGLTRNADIFSNLELRRSLVSKDWLVPHHAWYAAEPELVASLALAPATASFCAS